MSRKEFILPSVWVRSFINRQKTSVQQGRESIQEFAMEKTRSRNSSSTRSRVASTTMKLRRFFTFIRFSHTLFALPFALGSMIVAARGWPGCLLFGLILMCMVFARTAAMTFNRILDWEIDQRNPRTAQRHTLVNKQVAMMICGVSSLLFVSTTVMINTLCFILSPVALGVIFFYSFTKRFTSFAQFFLGAALAVAPVGAWIAVTGRIELAPLVLALGVLCWVAGFDIIYATQDVEIDKKEGLHSIVVWLGVPRALQLAGLLHVILFFCLIGFGIVTGEQKGYYFFLIPVPLLLWYEYRIAATLQINQINRAFFQTNVVVGFLFLVATIFGLS